MKVRHFSQVFLTVYIVAEYGAWHLRQFLFTESLQIIQGLGLSLMQPSLQLNSQVLGQGTKMVITDLILILWSINYFCVDLNI